MVDPTSWYKKDYEWSYEYTPKSTGIISSPVIEVIEKQSEGNVKKVQNARKEQKHYQQNDQFKVMKTR